MCDAKSLLFVYGQLLDDETRCPHYHSELDVIAIKCRFCMKYYPCYRCHNEHEGHGFMSWEEGAFYERAILCGVCRVEMTIHTYLKSDQCPECHALFNPACSLHHRIYFE